jgi:hypothetical protein
MSGLSLSLGLGLTALRAVAAAPSLLDNFTDADTTNLSAHTADSGEAWTATAGAVLINGNKAYPSTVTALYRSAWEPPSAEYDVEAVIEFKTIINQAVYIVARCADASNFYYAGKHATTHKWVFGKNVAGVFTELGTHATGPSAGNSYTLRLEVRDATKTFYVDDVQIGQSADNALTAAQRPGIRAAAVASTTTTGAHYDRLLAA